MAESTASSPKKRGTKCNPAKWDDDSSKILLIIFDEEIKTGNRAGGMFGKAAWTNILTKFNLRTKLNYSKEQLKNRQDNLRREYSKWESLIGKETGLGWDNTRRTLDAPAEWWIEKAKVDPAILRYKDAGPLHLELMQSVFGGVTANGSHHYIPEDEGESDPLLPRGDRLDDIIDFTVDETPVNLDDKVESEPSPTVVNNSKLPSRKRNRRSESCGVKVSPLESFSTTVQSFAGTIRDSVAAFSNSNRRPMDEEAMSYKEALMLLKSLPGMNPNNPLYWKGFRILEDRVKRIGFAVAFDDGLESVLGWLGTFP